MSDAFTRFERDRWQVAASDFVQAFSPLTAQVAGPLALAAGARSGARVLDVGSGRGDVAAMAARLGAEVTGVDLSEAMIAIARAAHPGLRFELAAAAALPFEGHAFDGVTMAFLLGHLAEPEAALHEAWRVLVPGGRLALAWWAGFDRDAGFAIVQAAIAAHGRADVGLPPGPRFDLYCDAGECLRAVAAAGFSAVAAEELALEWTLPSGEALFDAFARGTARTGGLIAAQSPGARAAIRDEVIRRAALLRRSDGSIELPMPVRIVSALKSA